MCSAGSLRSRSKGLTLVEVCLVLALLVIVGAIAAPVLEGTLSHAALQGGSDLLRGAWAETRLAAMQSGKTHVFRFEPNGSRFQLMRFDQMGLPETDALSAADPDERHDTADILRLKKRRRPDDVIFSGGDVAASAQVAAMTGTSDDGPWSGPIMFYADGTTSDATVMLTNDRHLSIRITLRGLTGISTASEIEAEGTL